MSDQGELLAWREAMSRARMIYQATESFPKSEQFGLTLQLRRAAVSVASNLAEGVARGSRKEFAQFLSVSLGSLAEVDTQLELATALGFLQRDRTLTNQSSKVGQLTNRLRQAISHAPRNGQRTTRNGQLTAGNKQRASSIGQRK